MNVRTLLLALICSVSVLLTGCQLPGQVPNGGLQVVTGEIPSSLFLDGQYLEKSPHVNKSIKPGNYTLRVVPDDSTLLPHDMSVTVKPGLMTVVTWLPATRPELNAGVTYELESIDGSQSELSFVSIPDGAIITVLGQPKVFAPTSLSLPPGDYTFEATLPSYQNQKHNVKLVEGYRTKVTLTLAKQSSDNTSPTTGSTPSATSSTSLNLGARGATASAQRSATGSAKLSDPGITTGPRVRILATNFRVNGIEGLRVRAAATPSGAEVGFAPTGISYVYTGKTENGWYEIEFEGKVGWVSGQYAQLITR